MEEKEKQGGDSGDDKSLDQIVSMLAKAHKVFALKAIEELGTIKAKAMFHTLHAAMFLSETEWLGEEIKSQQAKKEEENA